MKRNSIFAAAVVTALVVGGSAVAVADTPAASDETPTPVVVNQVQLRQQQRIQDPDLVATDEAPQLMTQTRQQLRIQDPDLMVGLQAEEQSRIRQAGAPGPQPETSSQARIQTQDPGDGLCDGDCAGIGGGNVYGNGSAYADGDCDGTGPGDGVAPLDGTGNQFGNRAAITPNGAGNGR
jgi:hypothetical protein